MPYKFHPKMYRMPTHFGPSLGPRQGPNDERFACKDNPTRMDYAVSFLTERKQLQAVYFYLTAGYFCDLLSC